MPSMNILLTPELLELVQSKVDNGLYDNVSEVIRDAIRQMDANTQFVHELKLYRLKEVLSEGVRQAESGDVAPLELNDVLESLNRPK